MTVKKVIKIVVSIALIGFLCYKLDWVKFTDIVLRMALGYFVIVVIIRFFQQIISAYKWNHFLEFLDLKFPFLYLARIYMIGFFLNNFLPSTIGGDGYRLIKTMRANSDKTAPVMAILFERVLGILLLILLGFIFSFYVESSTEIGGYSSRSIYLTFFVLIILMIFAAFALMTFFPKFIKNKNIVAKITSFKERIRNGKRNYRNLIFAILVSIVFHLMAFLSYKYLFYSFDVNMPYSHCALIVALTSIIAMIPVSINGIGLFEGTFVLILMQFGIDYTTSGTIAFVSRALNLIMSLFFGIFLFFENRNEIEASS